jgi:hypothetical protein
VKKLFGRRNLEDALKRLDKLTHEEARIATAEILKVTRTVDDRVKALNNKVTVVIHGVQTVLSQSLKIMTLNHLDGNETKEVLQQTANNVDQVKRSLSSNFISAKF